MYDHQAAMPCKVCIAAYEGIDPLWIMLRDSRLKGFCLYV